MNDYLSKPVRPRDLEQALQRCLLARRPENGAAAAIHHECVGDNRSIEEHPI
jgi:two-component SAPR family response regulator